MYRKNMGRGQGKGYYNLIKGYDSYIHSLSARGYRTMANNNLLYKTLPKSVPMPKLQLLSAGQFDSKFKDDYKDDEQGYATTRVTPDGKATIYVRDSGDIERTGKLIAHELNELAIFDHLVNDEGVDSQQAQVLAHNMNAIKVSGVDDTYELNAKGKKWKVTKDDYETLIANREGFIKVEKELLNKYPQLTEGEINSIILKDPEEFINLDKQSNVKIGDKIDVNDYGIGKIVHKPTYKNGTLVKKVKGSVAVHLVVEEDKSVRWYINPDESRGDLILDTQYIKYIGER